MTKSGMNRRDKYIQKTVRKTKRFLNKNIMILQADKGNVTVAMEKADYEKRMTDYWQYDDI